MPKLSEILMESRYDEQLDVISNKLNIDSKTLKDALLQVDPFKGKYIPWIIKYIDKIGVESIHDINKLSSIKPILEKYDKYKNIPSANLDKDIYKYTYDELKTKIDELSKSDIKSKSELGKEILSTGSKLYAENSNWAVYEITTPEALVISSWGTKWCTSNISTAQDYLNDGPMYIVFKKETGKLIKQYAITSDFTTYNLEDESILLKKELIKLLRPKSQEDLIRYAISFKIKIPGINPEMMSPGQVYYYARDVIEGRWLEAEPIIMKDKHYAWAYAYNVIQGRWPEVEPYIMKNPCYAYKYARDIIKGRWPEAEPYIKQDAHHWGMYCKEFGINIGNEYCESVKNL